MKGTKCLLRTNEKILNETRCIVQIVKKKATLGTSPYLLEQTLDKCINWHTRHIQEENCMVSIMGVFFN